MSQLFQEKQVGMVTEHDSQNMIQNRLKYPNAGAFGNFNLFWRSYHLLNVSFLRCFFTTICLRMLKCDNTAIPSLPVWTGLISQIYECLSKCLQYMKSVPPYLKDGSCFSYGQFALSWVTRIYIVYHIRDILKEDILYINSLANVSASSN